jgi:hypothetical protein
MKQTRWPDTKEFELAMKFDDLVRAINQARSCPMLSNEEYFQAELEALGKSALIELNKRRQEFIEKL